MNPKAALAMRLDALALLRYGLLGAPLAFAALPLYVLLPNFYATHYAVPLAALGTLLFVARLGDAFADPFIGRYVDRLLARGPRAALIAAAWGALVMVLGFFALWFAPRLSLPGLLAWLAVALALTYLAYSLLTVLHQSWGTQLSAETSAQSRISAYREGFALFGVLAASIIPSASNEQILPIVLAVLIVIALWMLARGPRPAGAAMRHAAQGMAVWRAVMANRSFARLCGVFVVNGVAAAIPATLLLFFVKDRLQAPDPGVFLLAYFIAAAASLPLWVQLVKRIGLERAWLAGMVLAIVTFVWAGALGRGDTAAFIGVCIVSGLAAGADLALPAALVARSIHGAGHGNQLEGSYFGVWGFLTKFNLALAAGVALPLLQWLGYTPGAQDEAALHALAVGYSWVPCALKAVAAVLLWALFIRGGTAHVDRLETAAAPVASAVIPNGDSR
jgi:Na+/melibiose symporter-like transporter